MSEQKHTLGPWRFFEFKDSDCGSWADEMQGQALRNGAWVKVFDCSFIEDINARYEQDEFTREEAEANARRIVACVNRLAPFTTEQIEDAGFDLFADIRPDYVAAVYENMKLQARIKELEAELKNARVEAVSELRAVNFCATRLKQVMAERDELLNEAAKIEAERKA